VNFHNVTHLSAREDLLRSVAGKVSGRFKSQVIFTVAVPKNKLYQKLMVTQLLKQVVAFYAFRKASVVFTGASYWDL
jgi:hypothetical protein